MKTHEEFMEEAIRQAGKNVSSLNGGPFGAVVVKNGIIISTGANMVTANHDPTAHAEIVAIRNACKTLNTHQLTDCDIYCSCEPCPMCLGAIYWARPGRIYYASTREDAAKAGFDDSFIYNEISLPPDERKIPAYQILRNKGIKVFDEWNKSINKIQY